MATAQIGRQSLPPANGPRLTRTVALVGLLVLALSYVVNAMDRQVFSVLLPGIRDEFGFSLAQGGLLATIFTLGIGVAGVPTGYLLDRLSRKSVILLGIAIYSLFTILTTVATGFPDMLAYRALSGVGEAMQNGALFAAVGAYFFANRAMALGTLNCAYGVGGFLGPLLGSKLADGGSAWRTPFWTFGLIGLVFIGIIALVIRKSFTERKETVVREGPRLDVDHVPVRLYNRNVLLLGLTAVVVGISMYGYIGLYPTFLESRLGFSNGQAALAASMFGLGAVLGIPAGWLGDRLNQRAVMIVAALAGCVVGYLLFNGPTTPGPQYALSIAEGAIASGFLFVNIYSAMQRAVRPHMIGRVSGLFVATFYLPAAFSGYLFSAFVAGTGWGGAGLWELTVLPLAGVVALFFVNTRKLARTTPSGGASGRDSLSDAEGS
ncbi:MFS transporter [Streptomyces sp. AK02-01A]|uniref:MFS transporter n=1 Tax=Streptomyces sp. AK02-01A TaxID=3028648 RepID=UPI0029A0F822|nr:MFS transporter [Streptomyces sp. AK02-01A]MDX3849207.1 MFS transporter [Streptomyces sp. AK02-01A]